MLSRAQLVGVGVAAGPSQEAQIHVGLQAQGPGLVARPAPAPRLRPLGTCALDDVGQLREAVQLLSLLSTSNLADPPRAKRAARFWEAVPECRSREVRVVLLEHRLVGGPHKVEIRLEKSVQGKSRSPARESERVRVDRAAPKRPSLGLSKNDQGSSTICSSEVLRAHKAEARGEMGWLMDDLVGDRARGRGECRIR